MAVTLQNVLDASSDYLGETGGTPATQTTIRTLFANDAKHAVRDMRNWSWELTTAAAINIVSGTTTYALPANFKNKDALFTVKILDTSGNAVYYAPSSEEQMDSLQLMTLADPGYAVSGNDSLGYTLTINPKPSVSVTNGLTFRYYAKEADFSALTDATAFPRADALGWFVAARVLYGYREQAQYQLAMSEWENVIQDLMLTDQKVQPYQNNRIQTYREYMGGSNNFKNYF